MLRIFPNITVVMLRDRNGVEVYSAVAVVLAPLEMAWHASTSMCMGNLLESLNVTQTAACSCKYQLVCSFKNHRLLDLWACTCSHLRLHGCISSKPTTGVYTVSGQISQTHVVRQSITQFKTSPSRACRCMHDAVAQHIPSHLLQSTAAFKEGCVNTCLCMHATNLALIHVQAHYPVHQY